MDTAAVSVIIPTRNKLPRLRLTLSSLARAFAPDFCAVEIVIVDDGSTDGTSEWLLSDCRSSLGGHDCLILRGERAGRSVARNSGAKAAKGEFLLFLDDDILVTAEHIRAHIDALSRGAEVVARGAILELSWLRHFDDPAMPSGADGVVSAMHVDAESIRAHGPVGFAAKPRRSWLERAIQERAERGALPYWSCVGANVSMRRTLFEAAGGFDPELGRTWGLEDLELGLRLSSLGARFELAEGAIAYHLSHYRAAAFAEHAIALEYVSRKHGEAAAALIALFEGRS